MRFPDGKNREDLKRMAEKTFCILHKFSAKINDSKIITGILISIPESLYFYYHMFYRTYILLCVFRIHSFENSLILLFHTQLLRKCFCFFHYNFAEC